MNDDTKHDDGGRAYPVPWCHEDPYFNGMSLWDHYYGLAMQGLVAGEMADWSDIPKDAADQADAMIAERKRRTGR